MRGNSFSGKLQHIFTFTTTTFQLYNNDEVEVTLSPPGVNAGSYTIMGGIAVRTGDPGNYEITTTDTVHTVRPLQAIVTTGSGTKKYDGEALVSPEASITGLVEGETALVTATGSQTEVGESTNTYAIDWDTTNPANYILTEKLGTLKVTDSE